MPTRHPTLAEDIEALVSLWRVNHVAQVGLDGPPIAHSTVRSGVGWLLTMYNYKQVEGIINWLFSRECAPDPQLLRDAATLKWYQPDIFQRISTTHKEPAPRKDRWAALSEFYERPAVIRWIKELSCYSALATKLERQLISQRKRLDDTQLGQLCCVSIDLAIEIPNVIADLAHSSQSGRWICEE